MKPRMKGTARRMIRILLVGDEWASIQSTKAFLEVQTQDFHVDTALSGDDALQKLSERGYDVVISGFQMPEIDGLEFLAELRRRESQIPFILFIYEDMRGVAVQALEMGADGYVNRSGVSTSEYTELANQIRSVVSLAKGVPERRAGMLKPHTAEKRSCLS